MERVQRLQQEADRILGELERGEYQDEEVTMRGDIARTPEAGGSRRLADLQAERNRVQAELAAMERRSPVMASVRREMRERAPFRRLEFPPSPESAEGSPSQLPVESLPVMEPIEYAPDMERVSWDSLEHAPEYEPIAYPELRIRKRGAISPEPGPLPRIHGKARRVTEPVGFAQRLKYKMAKKIQGLSGELERLQERPTQRELSYMVYSPSLKRKLSLRDSRVNQVTKEAMNLKADLEADGLDRKSVV